MTEFALEISEEFPYYLSCCIVATAPVGAGGRNGNFVAVVTIVDGFVMIAYLCGRSYTEVTEFLSYRSIHRYITANRQECNK